MRGKRSLWLLVSCAVWAAAPLGAGQAGPSAPAPAGDIPAARKLASRYNRSRSRVMVRVVTQPTRARLDFAAYDRNNLMHAPSPAALVAPTPQPRLADLTFGGALAPGSLCDQLAETPLTPQEKGAPLAITPLLDYLALWDYDASEKLMLAAARVSDEKWGNAALGRPLQRLATGYLHRAAEGTTELWAKVEFDPAVTFIEGVTDEDSDGYPEAYGRVDPAAITPRLVARIRQDYMGRMLTPKEVDSYFFELTSAWYRALGTFLLKPDEMRPWPNAATEPEVRAEMGNVVLRQPTAVIRGKPHGAMLYNVFIVQFASTSTPRPRAGT